MKRLQLWALIAGAATAAACASSSAEVDMSEQVEPDPALIRAAQQVLDKAPAPAEGWQVGVIVAEVHGRQEGLFGPYDTWDIGVLTADGSMVYLTGDYCDREPDGQQDGGRVLSVLVAPGDLVTWHADDHELCTSELRVLDKAAAGPAAPVVGPAGVQTESGS